MLSISSFFAAGWAVNKKEKTKQRYI